VTKSFGRVVRPETDQSMVHPPPGFPDLPD
jgi:hypothetical protein